MEKIEIKSKNGGAYFEVLKNRTVWIKVGMKATNAYYGNARISVPKYREIVMGETDQIHSLPAGDFLVFANGENYEVKLEKPAEKGAFEKSYPTYSYPELPVDVVREIDASVARSTKYHRD